MAGRAGYRSSLLSTIRPAFFQQAYTRRFGNRITPGADLELLIDVLEVILDRVRGDVQTSPDLLVLQALGE